MHLEFKVAEFEGCVSLGLDEAVRFWIRQRDDSQWDRNIWQIRAAIRGIVLDVNVQTIIIRNMS